MSLLIQTLIKDALAARKAGEKLKATLLVTLNAEIAKVGKDKGNRDTTEDEALKVIRKFVAGVEDSLKVITDPVRAHALKEEREILNSYLPSLMSENDLKAAIAAIVSTLETKSPKAMGEVMGKLKAQHGGQYDGAMAGALVKAALA